MITPEIHVSPELMAEFEKVGVSKEFATGDIVLDEEAYIRSIPLVTKGIIKVLRTEEDGREILLYYIKAGESCVMSLSGGLQGSFSKVRVEVEEDATILFLPAEKIPDLIKNHPEKLQQSFPDKQNTPIYETKIPNTASVSRYSQIYFSKQDPNK